MKKRLHHCIVSVARIIINVVQKSVQRIRVHQGIPSVYICSQWLSNLFCYINNCEDIKHMFTPGNYETKIFGFADDLAIDFENRGVHCY